MSGSFFLWNPAVIYYTKTPYHLQNKEASGLCRCMACVCFLILRVWKLYCSLSTGLWWSDRWFIGSQNLGFNGEHFYPFVLQSAQSLVTAEATNEGDWLREGPETITHKCPRFRSHHIPVWFNSLLLLKNSICLIELLGSKIWIPCILTIHIKFLSA